MKHTSDSLKPQENNATEAEVQEIASIKMFELSDYNKTTKYLKNNVLSINKLEGYPVLMEHIQFLER